MPEREVMLVSYQWIKLNCRRCRIFLSLLYQYSGRTSTLLQDVMTPRTNFQLMSQNLCQTWTVVIFPHLSVHTLEKFQTVPDARLRKTEKTLFVPILSTLLEINSRVFVTHRFEQRNYFVQNIVNNLLQKSKENRKLLFLSMLISHGYNPPSLQTILKQRPSQHTVARIYLSVQKNIDNF